MSKEFNEKYFKELLLFLENEGEFYPSRNEVFEAFSLTPFENVKVVIVGQDPYHGPGQAHGLCFSVKKGVKLPPSLKNIYKELQEDLDIGIKKDGCLDEWAKQGVLLLNTTLTVKPGEPLSHNGKGWERFTDAVIEKLELRRDPVVFILWGKHAMNKCKSVLHDHHLVLTAAHPSPLSVRKFYGCKHFSKANAFLKTIGKEEIDWAR